LEAAALGASVVTFWDGFGKEETGQQDKDSLPFGLAFIAPRIKLADEDRIQELIEAYLDQLDDYQHCDIWAYCAPGRLRRLKSDLTKLFYPLVIMLGKKLA
jgi:hypothetical protein